MYHDTQGREIEDDEMEDEMTYPKKSRYVEPVRQSEIVLEVRTVIGRVVESSKGQHPMVVEAFLQAGAFLNDKAARDGEANEVEFTYMGMRFTAACSPVNPENVADERLDPN